MTREESNEGWRCEKCKRIYDLGYLNDSCPYCELERVRAENTRLTSAVHDLEEMVFATEHLRAERQAAIDLLLSVNLVHGCSRIAWGYSPEHKIMGYFLDGVYAGQTYDDVLRAAVVKAEREDVIRVRCLESL